MILYNYLQQQKDNSDNQPANRPNNNGNSSNNSSGSSSGGSSNSNPTPPDTESSKLEIVVGNSVYTATLADTKAARQFARQLPMTVTMSELNSNEKYYNMDSHLPTAAAKPGTIETGDLMLYGSNCLVLFYKTFFSSYSYTQLGKLDDPTGLAQAVGNGSVSVTFRLANRQHQQAKADFDFTNQRVKLNSGYYMPIVGLGTYSLDYNTCVNSVTALLENGGRLIDTAYIYHNEEAVGDAIRQSNVPREEIFVTTKLYPNQFANAEQAIDQALAKLDVDYIDLMLLHHPGANDVAAYKAMEQAVKEGKIRSIGLSNWYVEELESFLPQVSITPAVVQNEIHPYYQENDVIPYIQDLGIVVEGWYPFGGRGHTGEMLGNPTISAIAKSHNVTSAQVILRWNLQKGVVVIPGSSKPDHIKENLDVFGFQLSDAEMAQINALDRNEKHDWY